MMVGSKSDENSNAILHFLSLVSFLSHFYSGSNISKCEWGSFERLNFSKNNGKFYRIIRVLDLSQHQGWIWVKTRPQWRAPAAQGVVEWKKHDRWAQTGLKARAPSIENAASLGDSCQTFPTFPMHTESLPKRTETLNSTMGGSYWRKQLFLPIQDNDLFKFTVSRLVLSAWCTVFINLSPLKATRPVA
jgi:hypothetical protein